MKNRSTSIILPSFTPLHFPATKWTQSDVPDIYIYFFYVLFYFIVILNVPPGLESMCQRKIFIFMLCILMNNKDRFDWSLAFRHFLHVHRFVSARPSTPFFLRHVWPMLSKQIWKGVVASSSALAQCLTATDQRSGQRVGLTRSYLLAHLKLGSGCNCSTTKKGGHAVSSPPLNNDVNSNCQRAGQWVSGSACNTLSHYLNIWNRACAIAAVQLKGDHWHS